MPDNVGIKVYIMEQKGDSRNDGMEIADKDG